MVLTLIDHFLHVLESSLIGLEDALKLSISGFIFSYLGFNLFSSDLEFLTFLPVLLLKG